MGGTRWFHRCRCRCRKAAQIHQDHVRTQVGAARRQQRSRPRRPQASCVGVSAIHVERLSWSSMIMTRARAERIFTHVLILASGGETPRVNTTSRETGGSCIPGRRAFPCFFRGLSRADRMGARTKAWAAEHALVVQSLPLDLVGDWQATAPARAR